MINRVKPSSANRKLSGVEAGRGIAAAMVVFYHAARHLKTDYGVMPWSGIAQFGHAGVDFFFVLSGFIIFFVHQQDLGKPSKLPVYFERRFTRIYPLFWFSLIVGIALTYFSSTRKFAGYGAILEQATLLPFGGDVGVAWTLQHEILFYMIFAAAIISRPIGIMVFVAWLGFILAAWATGYTPMDSPALATLASTFNLEFFFGMLAAYIIKNHTTEKNRTILALGTASFFCFALLENYGKFDGYASTAHLGYGLSAMLIVIGIAAANLNGQLTAPRFLKELGGASYSIYLLHLPCIGVIYKLLTVTATLSYLPLDIIYPLLVAGSIAGCIFISRLVEYPLINLVRGIALAFSKHKEKQHQPG